MWKNVIWHSSNCIRKHSIKQLKSLCYFGPMLEPVFSFQFIYKYIFRYNLRELSPFRTFLTSVKILNALLWTASFLTYSIHYSFYIYNAWCTYMFYKGLVTYGIAVCKQLPNGPSESSKLLIDCFMMQATFWITNTYKYFTISVCSSDLLQKSDSFIS